MRKHRSNSHINVLLVDDHAVARDGYRRLLARDNRFQVLGEASPFPEVQLHFEDPGPDVIVLDISVPGMSGIETLRRVAAARPPTARVLMFSQYEDPLYVSSAFDAGAHGYLTKSSAPEMLLTAIRTIAGGRPFVSPDVQQAMANSTQKVHKIANDLTHREHEILRLLIDGYNLSEIAKRLGLTAKTVANRQTAIKQKLGAGSAVQLIVIARRLGLSARPAESPSEKA